MGPIAQKMLALRDTKTPDLPRKKCSLKNNFDAGHFFFKGNLKPGDNSLYGTEISGYWQVPAVSLWGCLFNNQPILFNVCNSAPGRKTPSHLKF